MNAPIPQEITESLNIEQDNKKYILIIKIQGEEMSLVLSEPEVIGNPTFIKKMTLKEIKEKETHNLFLGLNSCNEFSDYIKALVERKKLSIIKKDENYCITFNVEYLFKNHTVEFFLSPEKKNTDEIIKDLCKEVNCLKEKIKILENKNTNGDENKELKNIIDNLKKDNENLGREVKNLKEEKKK